MNPILALVLATHGPRRERITQEIPVQPMAELVGDMGQAEQYKPAKRCDAMADLAATQPMEAIR